MLTAQQAQIILEFLRRVDIKGAEAPALMDVGAALNAIIENEQAGEKGE